jgi:hypothetical protein
MKYEKILRILGIAIILSLLLAAVSAVPALAYSYDIEIDPEQGAIGDEITITGDDFTPSTDSTERWAKIYFVGEEADEGDVIDTHIETYEIVESEQIGYLDYSDEGEFETTFEVPAELTDGDDDEDVAPGTYYICAVVETSGGLSPIRAVAEFTVIGGEIELYPEEGAVGTLVEITGEDFVSGEDIVIEYDGDEVVIEDGDDETDSSGDFESIISIPESTAGTHTITVIVSSSEVEAEFTVESDIVISPQSGKAGAEVKASGTGFSRREEVEIWFDDNIGVATTTTGRTGSFTASFKVPSGLEAGIYNVDAEDGTNVAQAKFTLTVAPSSPPPQEPTETPSETPTTPSPTSLSINQSGNTIGSIIGIGGAGFTPNTAITLKYDDKEVATTATDASGTFVATFQAPRSKHGDHIITASDGVITDEVTFAVESIAPPVPTPLLPKMGDKLKSPMSFDWEKVTDGSLPVTYVLQIAPDEDFTADSMVLEKTGLAESDYVLTEEEELELEGKETPYYWRIRAIDAASNEGKWTGAGEFYVSAPFALPNWALYTLLGIGAVIIFAVGYWLGRRTAFYY